MQSLVLASNNPHKLAELQACLKGMQGNGKGSYELLSASHFDIQGPAETGTTFVENAIIKARQAASIAQLPAIADDSGLEVDHLNGVPGIYSARFAGPQATDKDNNQKLLTLMANAKVRSARFRCVIVLLRHAADPMPIITSGTWEGEILHAPRGLSGFGYDPLFLLPALGKTSAELHPSDKNKLSHRGQALAALLLQLQQMTP